jgi:hypothetical protein
MIQMTIQMIGAILRILASLLVAVYQIVRRAAYEVTLRWRRRRQAKKQQMGGEEHGR